MKKATPMKMTKTKVMVKKAGSKPVMSMKKTTKKMC